MKKSRVLIQLRFDELMPKAFPPPPPQDEFNLERLFKQRIDKEHRTRARMHFVFSILHP